MRTFLILFLFQISFLSSVFSIESQPESHPQATEVQNSSLGLVSFFIKDWKTEPQLGSVHVSENDEVYFCVKLNPEDLRVKHALKFLRGIEVTLEGGSVENPQKIMGQTKIRKRILEPQEDGCFMGRVRIPESTPPGKYKITELDLWLSPRRSLSLRSELVKFSHLGVIEVESPHLDATPPLVEKIESKTPLVNRFKFGGKRGWAQIEFRVITTDLIAGVNPKSFHVFFKEYLDGTLVDIQEAKCKPLLPNLYYDCKLYFSRAIPELKPRILHFVLDSITLSDQLGNAIELTTEDQLKPLFGGKLLRYTFYSGRPKKGEVEQEHPNEDMIKWPVVSE